MRSSLAALMVAALGCSRIDTRLTISRGAPAIPAGIGESTYARAVSLPARPLLNRYDLLLHGGATECKRPSDKKASLLFPPGFVDYLDIEGAPSRPWLGSAATQYALGERILRATSPGQALGLLERAPTDAQSFTLRTEDCHDGTCFAIARDRSTSDITFFIEPTTPPRFLPVAYRENDSWILDMTKTETEPSTKLIPFPASAISTPIFSFVHLTDVQLREATARVGSPKQSKGLDQFVDSFEHDFEQDLFVDVVLDALVKTINYTVTQLRDPTAKAAREPQLLLPSFVIHTGDAIDVGLKSELRTFHRIMDRLEIPWLSAIGNHDVFAFGNLIPDKTITTDALAYGAKSDLFDSWWWRWIGSYLAQGDWSVAYDESSCPGCEDGLVATKLDGDCFVRPFIDEHSEHTIPPQRFTSPWKQSSGPPTRNHGFDLNDNKGYYAFDLEPSDKTANPSYRLRVIVLNTDDFGRLDEKEKEKRGGEGGYVGREQLDWLGQQGQHLAPNHLLLVFGHHPLSTIRRDIDESNVKCDRDGGNQAMLRQALGELAKTGRLLGYFAGHKHGHEVTLQETADHQQAFWEVQTGAIIRSPQEARWVTLRVLGDGLGFLELVPFGQQVIAQPGSPLAETLARAERGAKRDKCRKNRCIDGEPVRDGKHGAVRLFVRLPKLPSPIQPAARAPLPLVAPPPLQQ